jgi:predicted acyl esterase
VCSVVFVNAQQSYQVDSLITIQSDTVQLGASLYLPKTKVKVPALVMVSGTGPQDRNGTMAGYPFFKQIATFLVGKGYAVLLVDDRGVGKSTGNYASATTADFANDALAAVKYLRTQSQINREKIGLIGHSEGGAASAIAAAQSTDVKFIISLAGLASNGFASLIQQNEDLVNHSPLSATDKSRANTINRLMFETALKYADTSNMGDMLNETYNTWKKVDDSLFKLSGVAYDHFRFPLYSYVKQATGKWYRYFIKYDAQKTMKQIKVPVLAINGDKDLMVNATTNLANWKNYIAAGGNTKVTTLLFSSVNHLLQYCETCKSDEYAKIKSGVSVEVLNAIASWLDKEIK